MKLQLHFTVFLSFSVDPAVAWCVSSDIQHWLRFRASRHWGQMTACQRHASLLGETSSRVFVQAPEIRSPPTSYAAVSSVSLSGLCLHSIQHSPKHQYLHFKQWQKHEFSQETSGVFDLLKRPNNSQCFRERQKDGYLVHFISPVSFLQHLYAANIVFHLSLLDWGVGRCCFPFLTTTFSY